ncbi:hypothetical protein FB45DRAFT_1052518 [Roridomyces roridus]|uniref:ARM repeat superfamily protein n=1 Tax=Roridomyces roridus TaxID=1738132 RepID=A0AAD7CA31_9AGAR|nr:hypothetical protein FB45DRAFT_1052518 [Roridomyces roridus]
MQSLGNRDQSQVSLLSWWSDSNPGLKGPMHTMTKPLLWLMYHRQALEYIRLNSHKPLTEAMLDILSSYIECKYVASRTKLRVLSHLSFRAQLDMKEAQNIADSSVFSAIPLLLESSDVHIRRESAKLITRLWAVVAPINALDQISEKLGSLLLCSDENTAAVELTLHDKYTDVVEEALDSLIQIAFWLPGAQTIVASDALEHAQELVAGAHPIISVHAAVLIGTVACHSEVVTTIAPMIEKVNPFERIVVILKGGQSGRKHIDSAIDSRFDSQNQNTRKHEFRDENRTRIDSELRNKMVFLLRRRNCTSFETRIDS